MNHVEAIWAMLKSIQFFRYRDIVPLAKNCTEIYVWHTMTMAPSIQLSKSVSDLKDLKTSNVGPLLNNMKKTGLLFF